MATTTQRLSCINKNLIQQRVVEARSYPRWYATAKFESIPRQFDDSFGPDRRGLFCLCGSANVEAQHALKLFFSFIKH